MHARRPEQERSYDQLMARWGYAPTEDRQSIGFLLRLLREQYRYSRVYQRCCLGIGEADFRHLQRLAGPRPAAFAEDVRQAALACNVPNMQYLAGALAQAQQLLAQASIP